MPCSLRIWRSHYPPGQPTQPPGNEFVASYRIPKTGNRSAWARWYHARSHYIRLPLILGWRARESGHDDYFDHEVAVHDLAHFTSADGAECGAAIRETGVGANSLEEVATRIVQFLRSDLTSAELPPSRPSGPARAAPPPVPPSALVRCFVTVPYGELDADLQ